MDVNGINRQNPEIFTQSSTTTKPDLESKSIEKVEGFQAPEKAMAEMQRENKEKNEEKLKEAVDKINKTAVIFDRSLRFQVHEATHRTMVSVVDIVQDKVIRQIPEEEVLDLVAKMQDYIGLIFDKKA